MNTKRINKIRLIAIVLAAVLVLLCAALAFAGNFLFNFALNPNASFTMNDLFERGSVEGVGGDAAVELSPAREDWHTYSAAAYEWYAASAEPLELPRPDGSVRRAGWFPQEGHKYAIIFHGYTGAAWQMAPFGKVYYDEGWSVLFPDALAHGESDGDYIGMGWLERSDVLDWIGGIVERDPDAEIVLHGVSMGGATVMMAAGEALPENVKCIIEDCGYSSVWDEFRLQLKNVFGLPAFPLLNAASLVCQVRAGYSFREASSVRQLQKASVPMLFIHGDADTFVPFEMLDVVYEACASAEKEKLVVHGAPHGDAADTDPELYWSTVAAFVGKYVS